MKKSIFIAVVLICFASLAFSQAVNNDQEHSTKVIPMPLPEWAPPVGELVPETSVVSYDIKTGIETEEEIEVTTTIPFDFVPGFEGTAPLGNGGLNYRSGADNYGGLSRVYTPEDWPYRANCKIFMTFPSGWTYEGSAVLIDNDHVLTAGHCVYYHGDGGWATAVEVIPGYESGWEPYGSAWASILYTWSGWTQNANLDHDMGVIKLNTAIGNTTGYYGYGYTDNMSYYKTGQFYNPGYPASYPYSGNYMYLWGGSFDDTSTYVLYFDREAYGGQSGSGHTTPHSGSYYSVAVLSHGTSYWTGNTRMTSSKHTTIQGWLAKD